MPGRVGRGRLSWTLLTLAFGYALLVLGPLYNARGSLSNWLGEFTSAASGLPQPLTIGIALLGAAALIMVVARQVRDLELNPYASIAPVLTVFSGLVLSSIRAQLPFPSLHGPQLGLAGLTLALLGGALIGRRELGARLLGCALVALPSLALMLALTATRGDGDPIAMLHSVDAPLRSYLLLLAVSSLTLGLVGQFARGLVRRQERDSSPMLRLAPNATTPVNLRAPTLRASHYDSPAAFAAAYVPGSYAQHGSPALALDDPDLLALTRKRGLGAVAWTLAAALGLAALGGYFLVYKPEQDRLAAQERARSLKAAQARTEKAAQPRDELADRMARYLEERAQERSAAVTAPVVTPLAAPVPEQALAPRVEERAKEPVEEKAERGHHRHHRRHHARHVEAADPVEPRAVAPAKLAPAPAKREAKLEAKPEPAKPTKPAPKSQNERELDLDELLEKSIKGGGKNHGADDPILGL